jgi:hypothetical protein
LGARQACDQARRNKQQATKSQQPANFVGTLDRSMQIVTTLDRRTLIVGVAPAPLCVVAVHAPEP